MAYGSGRLPSRFPVGTKFVIKASAAAKARCKSSAGIWNFPTAHFSRCRPTRSNGSRAHPPLSKSPSPRTASSSANRGGRRGPAAIGQWPTRASGGPGLGIGQASRVASAAVRPSSSCTIRRQHKIVAVDHLGASGEAENQQDIGRGTALRSFGVLGVESEQSAAHFAPSGPRTITASPRPKPPSTLITPAGNRLLPPRSACTAPASMTARPRFERPAIHFLRAVTGSAGVRNQVQGAPSTILSADVLRGPMRSPCAYRRWWRSCRPRSWSACRRARVPSRRRRPWRRSPA